MTTGRMRVVVRLDPYRLEIEDPNGRPICGIGGPEKDCFHNWDSYNTGLCRAAGGDVLAMVSFDLAHDECVYGFGEGFSRLNSVCATVCQRQVETCRNIMGRAFGPENGSRIRHFVPQQRC